MTIRWELAQHLSVGLVGQTYSRYGTVDFPSKGDRFARYNIRFGRIEILDSWSLQSWNNVDPKLGRGDLSSVSGDLERIESSLIRGEVNLPNVWEGRENFAGSLVLNPDACNSMLIYCE